MPAEPATSRLRGVPIMSAQLIGLVCGIIGLRINSHLLPPATLGIYGVFLTFAPIGAWVVHAGLAKYLMRYWATSTDRSTMGRQVVRIWFRRLPWLLGGAVVAGLSMQPLVPESFSMITGALFVATASSASLSLIHAALQAERAHWQDLCVSGWSSLSRTLLPPLWFAASGGLMATLWWGFGLHALSTALLGILIMRRYWQPGSPATAPPPAIPAVYRGSLFIVLSLATWSLTGLNRWLVAGFFGETEAGFFTLASSMAVIGVTMISNAWIQYVRPGLFALGDGEPGQSARLPGHTDRIALAYTAAAGIALWGIIQTAPWLLGWLIDPRYEPAFRWLLPSGCFAIALNTMHFFHLFLLAAKRERASARPELITAAVLILGGLISASFGLAALRGWLIASPVVAWTLTRSLAHRIFAAAE